MAVLLDEEGGGQEESPAHHGDEAAEQQGELQRAELPEERVAPPEGVGDLQEHSRTAASQRTEWVCGCVWGVWGVLPLQSGMDFLHLPAGATQRSAELQQWNAEWERPHTEDGRTT